MTHEKAPRPTDDDLIDEAINWAERNQLPIPDSAARRIALQHHAGQSSALYSFGSTGAIDHERLAPELKQALTDIELSQAGEAGQHVSHLIGYMASNEARGPVEGWHRITEDGLPAVFYVEQLRPEQYIGTYEDKRKLAQELLNATGLPVSLMQLHRRLGRGVMKYVILDLDQYIYDLKDSVRMTENENGGIDAYWRL